jgi:hypothetical protein
VVKAVKEITQWDSDIQANHTYLMDGNKAVAYIPFGKGVPFYFKTGLVIDRARRKFEELADNPFGSQSVKSDLIEIKGSKGDTYFIDTAAGTCTCSGFVYRGACRHVKEFALICD